MTSDSPELFPLQTDAELWLSGSPETGGKGVIRDFGQEVIASFSPSEFAVIAILIMAAREDAVQKEDWAAAGFRSVRQLKAAFRDLQSQLDSEYMTKYVFAARKRLEGAWRRFAPARGWGKRFLETNERRYRLSTHPSKLHLDLVID
jgi:hypothetical protein